MKLRNIFYQLIIIVFMTTHICAQSNPVVTNVTFVNNISTTGNVDIYYDVTDAEQSTVTIFIKVSDDGGTTYNYACTQVTEDLGTGVTTGTNKHIVWDFALEHPGASGSNFKIKIIANDEVAGGSTCPGVPTVDYSGKTYNTIQIGDQCWLKENLNVGIRINGNLDQQIANGIEKYCYGDDDANCTTYGGLYQWNEAMQYLTTPGTKGICPTGWHIPTNAELQTLAAAVNDNDGNALKEIGQGTGEEEGTNTSGFSALLVGVRGYDGGFYYLGVYTYVWSSTESDASSAGTLGLYSSYSGIYLVDDYGKDGGFSVRCLKD